MRSWDWASRPKVQLKTTFLGGDREIAARRSAQSTFWKMVLNYDLKYEVLSMIHRCGQGSSGLTELNLYSDQTGFGYAREEDEVTDTETVAW